MTKIQISQNVANWIVAIASMIPSIAALLVVTDGAALGLNPDWLKIVTAWLVLIGGIVNIVVIALRLDVVPGVESGVALDAEAALRESLKDESGQWYNGGALGLFALVVIILFVAWLMVRADILRVP